MPELLTDEEVGLTPPAPATPKLLSDEDVGLAPKPEPTFSPAQYFQQGVRSTVRGVANAAASIPEAFAPPAAALERQFGDLGGVGHKGVVEEQGTYKTGRAIRDLGEMVAPEAVPGLEESFWASKVPEGVGSTVPMVIGGMAGAVAKLPALVIPLLMGAAQGASSGYEDAKSKGATENQKLASSLLNAGVGLSEAAPLGRLFRFLDNASGHTFKTVISHSVKEGAEEALQEAFQSGAGDAIAKWFVKYDPNREMFNQLQENAAVGGVVGTTLGLLTGAIGLKLGRMQQQRQERQQARNEAATGLVADELGKKDAATQRSEFDSLMASLNEFKAKAPNENEVAQAGTIPPVGQSEPVVAPPAQPPEAGTAPAQGADTAVATVPPAPVAVVPPVVIQTDNQKPQIVELPSLAPAGFKIGDPVAFTTNGNKLEGNVVAVESDAVIVEDNTGHRTRVSGRVIIPSGVPTSQLPEPPVSNPPKKGGIRRTAAAPKLKRAVDPTGMFVRIVGEQQQFPVKSYDDAAQKFSLMRVRSGLGASEMPPVEIVDAKGKRIARISYNGKIWDTQDKLIYDPFAAEEEVVVSAPPPVTKAAAQPEGADTSFLPPEDDAALSTTPPAPTVPQLRPGERGTGDLLQGPDAPFNLAGETVVDHERVARERAAAEAAAAAAKRLQDEQQRPLFSLQAPFYSRLQRAVEAAPQNKATGAQWKGMIRGSKLGINADEFALVGVGDLEDGRSYTKQEVLDYLRANEVVVKDVTLGENVKKVPLNLQWEYLSENILSSNLPNGNYVTIVFSSDPTDGAELQVVTPDAVDIGNPIEFPTVQAAKAAAATMASEKDQDIVGGTHFGTYQLPGAKEGSYREVLLTVPASSTKTPENPKFVFTQRDDGKWFAGYGEFRGFGDTKEAAIQDWKMLAARGEGRSWRDGHSQYASVANPIVRLRFNERTLPAESRAALGISKSVDPDSGRKKLQNLLSGESAALSALDSVNPVVLGAFQNDKVRSAVISNLPVNVVNILTSNKLSPADAFSKDAMVHSSLSLDARHQIAAGIIEALRKTSATARAKILEALLAGRDKEILPAIRASDLSTSEVRMLLTAKGVELGNTSASESFISPTRTTGERAEVGNFISSGEVGLPAPLARLLNSHTDIVNRDKAEPQETKRILFLEEVQAPQKGQFEKMPALFQKNWREIAFKWALRHAAANGFDAVGWTSGEQQAQRYDLSKQISSLRYAKEHTGGGYRISVIRAGRNAEWQTLASNVPDENIEQYVGKEIAKKILDGEGEQLGAWTKLSGVDLKVGGEGLKRLYDVDFRNVVNGLPVVKKAGQKVGVKDIPTGPSDYKGHQLDEDSDLSLFGAFEDEDVSPITEGEAASLIEQGRRVVGFKKDQIVKVPTISITPEMRQSIMAGQPLFQAGTRTQGLPAATVQQFVAANTTPGAVPIQVVQSVSDLPQQVQDAAAQDGINAGQIRAVIFQGNVYLVADNISDTNRITASIAHEIIGHQGIDDELGRELQSFMEGVVQLYQGTPELAEVQRLYLGGNEALTPEQRLLAGRELVARLAENPNLNPSLWQRIVAFVKGWLRKLGLNLDISDSDIRDALRRARNRTKATGINTEPQFKLGDVEDMTAADDLLRNPSPEEQPLIAAELSMPNDALYSHVLPAFSGLSRAAQNRLPQMQDRAALMARFPGTGDPRPLLQQAQERFPNQPEIVQQIMAAAFANAERFRADGIVLREQLGEVVDQIEKLNAQRDKLDASTVRVEAARGLAKDMIQQANDALDQRIASERNAAERATLENTRRLVANFLTTPHMASILKAASHLNLAGIRQLATAIKDPASTVASIKARFKIFDGVSDDVAEQALGVMRLNAELYEQLITAKNATNPKLARDIAQLDQSRLGQPFDMAAFAEKYAEVSQISADHAKLLDAVTRDLRAAMREFNALTSANAFVQGTMASAPFQQNWADAVRSLGATTEIKTDNGIDMVYKNPNAPDSTETITISTALDHATAQKNSAKLVTLAGWMQEYLEKGTDPVLKESYRQELEWINHYLRSPEVDPRTGNRLTRGAFDITRIFSGFGRLSTPDTVGRFLGGEMGLRVRQAVRNFSEARSRVMNQFAELTQDIARKSVKAATEHGMTVDEWTRRVSEPILQSYMAVGDRHLNVDDSLPGGLIVSRADMAAVEAQSRFIKKMMGDIQNLPKELTSFLFAPSKITATPERPGARVIMRDPIPLTKHGVPRRISSVGNELATKWQKIGQEIEGTMRQNEEYIRLINDPKYRDIFLSYFRSFSDPTFIANRSPLRESALEVNRDINLGDVPVDFEDMITRLQEKEAQRDPPVLLSRSEVQGLLFKDLSQVMAAVASDQRARDVSATASQTDIIDAQNFMNRPRGETIAIKGMYDLSMVNEGQQMQKAAQTVEVYAQAMLNSWRAAKEALQAKKVELEARIKAGEAREEVNADTEAAMRRGDQFYKLAEIDDLLSQLDRNIDQAKSAEKNQAAFEQQMTGPRFLRLIKGFVLSGLLQRVSVMGNNFFGGVNKMNQMDALLNLTQPPLGIDSPLARIPVSMVTNTGKAARNLFRVVRDGISASMLDTEWGKATVANMDAHPELYQGLSGAMLRRMVQWSRRYEEAERLGLYNFAPFFSQLKTRLELRKIGGEIRGNNPTKWLKQFDKVANILEILFETGIFLGRAPSAWLPGVVDAAINVTAFEKTQEMLGVVQMNILKAFRNRVAMGQDPATIRLTPQEFLGKPQDANMEKEFAHLQSMFTENNLNLDQLARDYYANVQAAGANAGQVWLTDKLGVNSLANTVANEMNRASFANRPQNMASDSWGKFFMNLLGYGINENAKLGLLWAKAARNPKRFAELQTSLRYIMPMMLMVLTLGTFVAAPLIDKLLELWEGKKRPRPTLANAEDAADVTKALGYAAGPLLPMAGQFINTMVQPDAPGRGIMGSNLQLLPLSLANSFMDFMRQVKDTREFVRPALQFNAQWNPSSNVAVNRLPMMQGWLAFQNDSNVQRKLTPSSIELRKQGAGAPVQYSPVWGEIQDIKNELGKQNPDQAKIAALREAGIQKLTAKGNADPAKSFDRALLASANKYLNIYGRELTQAEKDRIDAKKTPEELAESQRIEANVVGYANQFGAPAPDFVRVPKGDRATTRQLTGGASRTETALGSSGSTGTGQSGLGLSSGPVGGGRMQGGGGAVAAPSFSRGGLRRSTGRRGYGLRRISANRRAPRLARLRAPRRTSRLRRVRL